MLVLVTYDVKTDSEGGTRRLRRIAKLCRNHGLRVLYRCRSVGRSPGCADGGDGHRAGQSAVLFPWVELATPGRAHGCQAFLRPRRPFDRIRPAKYTVDGCAQGMREVFRRVSLPPMPWA